MAKKEEKPLKKDKECVYCEKLFDCKGRPRHIDKCLNFRERKKGGKYTFF